MSLCMLSPLVKLCTKALETNMWPQWASCLDENWIRDSLLNGTKSTNPLSLLVVADRLYSRLSMRFGDKPNVIFEIFNEPIYQLWNETIKPYHEKIVSESLLQIRTCVCVGQKWAFHIIVYGQSLGHLFLCNASGHSFYARSFMSCSPEHARMSRMSSHLKVGSFLMTCTLSLKLDIVCWYS